MACTAPKPPGELDTPEKRIEYAKMLASYAAVDEYVSDLCLPMRKPRLGSLFLSRSRPTAALLA